MKTLLVFLGLFIISFSALAEVCPTQINYKTWLELDKDDHKKMLKILKKKGFIHDKAGAYKLTLELSMDRSSWKGQPTDSVSRAIILKDGEELTRSEKTHTAIMNDAVVSQDYGIQEIVIGGATKEGVQRRMIKAIKKLPTCENLLEGSSR